MLKKLKRKPIFVFLFFVSILVVWPTLFPGYFSHHDDLQVIRILEMRKCITDLQIPCRWVPDMGYGFGIPLFNFYNPAVYYIGGLASLVTGFVGAAKTMFLISLILGPIGMYFLVRELWGRWPGIVSAIVFMFAPYRALDAYVRGALSELFAISLIPFIFLFIYRLVKSGRKKDFVVLTLLSALFFISHNVSVIIWAPFIFLWTLYWIMASLRSKAKSTKHLALDFRHLTFRLLPLALSLVIAFSLSAFFTIPAFTERGLVTTGTLTTGDLDYHVHFTNIKQLFLGREWGYGASKLGPNDELSLQIGWPHWWIVIFTIFLLVLKVVRSGTYKLKKGCVLPLLFISFFLISIFMTHNKSTPIWNSFDIFAYLQFPWRYLSVSVFAASVLGGFVVESVGAKLRLPLALSLILLAVALNWQYFRPQYFYPYVNDSIKLSGNLWDLQQKGSLMDYLPLHAPVPGYASTGLKIIKKGGTMQNFVNRTNYWEFEIINASSAWEVEVPVFDFPNWEVTGGQKTVGENGLIHVSGSGDTMVKGVFRDTPVRTFSNWLSIFSVIFLVFILKNGKTKKIFNK